MLAWNEQKYQKNIREITSDLDISLNDPLEFKGKHCDHCQSEEGKVDPVSGSVVQLDSMRVHGKNKMLCYPCRKSYLKWKRQQAFTTDSRNWFERMIDFLKPYPKNISAKETYNR